MLKKFCFIDKDIQYIKVEAESLDNISITNRYCKIFPCILTLEKNIKDIPDTSCGLLNNLSKGRMVRENCNGNNNGLFVMYNGNNIFTINGKLFFITCYLLEGAGFDQSLSLKKSLIYNISNVDENAYITSTNYNLSTIPVTVTNTSEKTLYYNITYNSTKYITPSPIINTNNKTNFYYINNTFTKYRNVTKTCQSQPLVYKIIYPLLPTRETNKNSSNVFTNTQITNNNATKYYLKTPEITNTKSYYFKIPTKTILINKTTNLYNNTITNTLKIYNSKSIKNNFNSIVQTTTNNFSNNQNVTNNFSKINNYLSLTINNSELDYKNNNTKHLPLNNTKLNYTQKYIKNIDFINNLKNNTLFNVCLNNTYGNNSLQIKNLINDTLN